MRNEIKPLAPALWIRRIEMIARGELGNVERALRPAAHLIQLTPKPFRDVVRLSLGEETFEALLEAGALDTAAKHLIVQPTALTVRQDPSGSVEAVISCVILKPFTDQVTLWRRPSWMPGRFVWWLCVTNTALISSH